LTGWLALLVLAIWAGMLVLRDGFWLEDQREDAVPFGLERWPSVVAVVPARDEAEVVGRAVANLVAQDYPGDFRIILVDDNSADGTASVARMAAKGDPRLTVLTGGPLPHGWTGKLWALSQGIEQAGAPDYLWLTDADIAHAPDTLRVLAGMAVPRQLALVSLMARLQCRTFSEKLLVPAFVLFFQMLFPFRAVNRPGRVAAAAGGCMFVDAAALAQAGGIGAVRGAIIDDCALGALLKRQGPIRLALTSRALSLRDYGRIGDIGAMISRSAYAQLRYSPLLLAGTLVGLALVFMLPPILALAGQPAAVVAWLLMALSFQPMLRFYGQSPLWGLALPLIAAIYGWYTFVSALQVWRGRGGQWKGRSQALLQP
jgi:hopene-associated glycosyltransferase HpnB